MASTPERYGPRDRLSLLEHLKETAGFRLYEERVERMVAESLDEKIFDLKTSDQECRILRETRARIMKEFTPSRVVDSLLASARTEVQRQDAKSG